MAERTGLEVRMVLEGLEELFPLEQTLYLDQERTLKLRVQGLRYLEKHYGSDEAMLLTLAALEAGKGRIYEDLPHFVYACLLRSDGDSNDGQSPLAVVQLLQLIDDGASIDPWLEPASQAVHNFFLHRTRGNAAKARPGAPGPGTGPTG